MKKKIILFDIDYTLFDTDAFRDATYPKLREILHQKDTPQFYLQTKQAELTLRKAGGFGPIKFAELLAEMLQIEPEAEKFEELFYNEDLYNMCLYPEVEAVLSSLSRQGNVLIGILSTGEQSFQERKIASIRHFFQENMIHIYTNKFDHINEVLSLYKNQELIVVDDSPVFFDAVKEKNEYATAILIKRDKKHEENFIGQKYTSKSTVTNLAEVIDFV